MIVEADVERCGGLADIDLVMACALRGVHDISLGARTTSNLVGASLLGDTDGASGVHVLLDTASGVVLFFGCFG